jgi:glycosyltransferase involved in cell wall biosynthesis
MWPWFGSTLSRRINRALLRRQLQPLLKSLSAPPIAVTTLPITADLIGELPVQRWVYYCVDDFGQWPGLDQAALRRLDDLLIQRADVLLAVSETLQDRIRSLGRQSTLLTHGVDNAFWSGSANGDLPLELDALERPLVVFWGVIDRRMDLAFVQALSTALPHGTILLVGPQNEPDPALLNVPRVVSHPPMPFAMLPRLAREASVLIMPYADLPVTRAIQPLKLKEYLAAGRPVVVRSLPATKPWTECLDLAEDAGSFAQLVIRRLNEGVSEAQIRARACLANESWQAKADLFERLALSWTGCNGQVEPEAQANEPLRTKVVLETRVVAGSGGGPDKTILNTPRFLAGTRYPTICAYMHPPGDPGFEVLGRKAALWGAPLVSITDRGFWDWRVIGQLVEVCRRQRVAIWHGHDYKSNALGLLLRNLWPMRLVTTVHGWVHFTPRTPFYYWVDRWCLPRYEKVICVSEDLRQRCLECGVPARRCVLIENAIDTEEFSRRLSIAEARQPFGVSARRLLLGAIGRLSAEKGFDLLIRAVAQLVGDGLDVGLLIAGEGDEREPLVTLITELGLADRVKLLGYCSDPRGLYQAFDVYVLSSLREGLPNVLLEAMALELPVVATRIGGVPRLIQDGVNGLLVEPGTVSALAGAVGRLASDPELRTRLGRVGRETIEKGYSFAVRMEKVRQVYDEL